jgi:hypothetical protein
MRVGAIECQQIVNRDVQQVLEKLARGSAVRVHVSEIGGDLTQERKKWIVR